jgi:hypothetical protein
MRSRSPTERLRNRQVYLLDRATKTASTRIPQVVVLQEEEELSHQDHKPQVLGIDNISF